MLKSFMKEFACAKSTAPTGTCVVGGARCSPASVTPLRALSASSGAVPAGPSAAVAGARGNWSVVGAWRWGVTMQGCFREQRRKRRRCSRRQLLVGAGDASSAAAGAGGKVDDRARDGRECLFVIKVMHVRMKGPPADPSTPSVYVRWRSGLASMTAQAGEYVPGLSVVECFVSEEEEMRLLELLDGAAGTETPLQRRRVVHFGFEFDYKTRSVDPTKPLGNTPPPLVELGGRVLAQGIAPWVPDQYTLNVYDPGQGIAPHCGALAVGPPSRWGRRHAQRF